jgi:hypothetical protein
MRLFMEQHEQLQRMGEKRAENTLPESGDGQRPLSLAWRLEHWPQNAARDRTHPPRQHSARPALAGRTPGANAISRICPAGLRHFD